MRNEIENGNEYRIVRNPYNIEIVYHSTMELKAFKTIKSILFDKLNGKIEHRLNAQYIC